MRCLHPLQCWTKKGLTPNGKKPITFKKEDAENPQEPLTIGCGQCWACRLERARQWAMRCVHEASLYEDNCFITLTYNDENLPKNGTLKYEDFQLFMKKLRKKFGSGIRFYMCGEYGEEQDPIKAEASPIGRPHFHACIFNFDFPDKELWKTINGVKLYLSETLDKLWNKGYATIGDVTFESAGYVARYVMKKITGDNSKEHYHRIDMTTGEMTPIKPEFTNMSRRPGIAKGWWDKYKSDLEKDFITMRGVKMKPPKYYDNLLEKDNQAELEKIKQKRMEVAKENSEENEYHRRRARKEILAKKLKKLPRKEI